jgi:hypothetical protein
MDNNLEAKCIPVPIYDQIYNYDINYVFSIKKCCCSYTKYFVIYKEDTDWVLSYNNRKYRFTISDAYHFNQILDNLSIKDGKYKVTIEDIAKYNKKKTSYHKSLYYALEKCILTNNNMNNVRYFY